MQSGRFRFDRFELDADDRRLLRDGVPVDINSRYLDALALLLREAGRLVSKDRFLGEVWRGVPVTDEALTQCIKTLRRQLDDDAANPRFIETVPKHGYRFVAAVEAGGTEPAGRPQAVSDAWRRIALLGAAGTIGGGIAGFAGGLIYGFAGASQPGAGAISVMLVLLCLCILVALMGGAGVGFGIAAASHFGRRSCHWTIAGGAAGGMIVGGLVKLLGIDAFNLLLGRSPGDITGGAEGAVLGAAVGLGAWLSDRTSLRRGAAYAGAVGAVAGLLIVLFGGRLMGGSLELLGRSFPGSRLRIDQLGALVGEDGFGPVSRLVTGALEGGLFSACLVGAMILARRSFEAVA